MFGMDVLVTVTVGVVVVVVGAMLGLLSVLVLSSTLPWLVVVTVAFDRVAVV